MILDCHVHISATQPGHGKMSPRLLKSLPFRFMRWWFGIDPADPTADDRLRDLLIQTVHATPELDAAVILAFDAVYTSDGHLDDANTHLYVTNDYVIELVRTHGKLLFGCSVHPYRADAVAELERCAAAGAVLCKWLPVTQKINPADPRCTPFFEALAHFRIPLLSHTGGEQSLPVLDRTVEDPALLEPALRAGVTVIAAHCGTRSVPWGRDYVPQFLRLARQYENCYGDTAALNLPSRWYGYKEILKDALVRAKLVHGSDWPIIPLPPPLRTGLLKSRRLMQIQNWLSRDIAIKRVIGFDDAYWTRAASILRLLQVCSDASSSPTA